MRKILRNTLASLLAIGTTVTNAVALTYPANSDEYRLLKRVSTDVIVNGRKSTSGKIKIFEEMYASGADTLKVVVIDGDNNERLSEGDKIEFPEDKGQPYEHDTANSIIGSSNTAIPSYRMGERGAEVVPSRIYRLILDVVIMNSESEGEELLKKVAREVDRATARDSSLLLTKLGRVYEDGRH